MTKVLSQAGISLADVYDIEGSIVGIDQLESREVHLAHEMGATIFSERLSQRTFRAQTGAIAQSTGFDVGISGLPNIPTRVLALIVTVDTTSRLANCAVSLGNEEGVVQEIPIWAWDGTNESTLRFLDAGVLGSDIALVSDPAFDRLPTLLMGTDQPRSMGTMVMRGTTSAFGAGDVTITLIAMVAFSEIGGISSYGLPIPSW